jgi:hypothetical protein
VLTGGGRRRRHRTDRACHDVGPESRWSTTTGKDRGGVLPRCSAVGASVLWWGGGPSSTVGVGAGEPRGGSLLSTGLRTEIDWNPVQLVSRRRPPETADPLRDVLGPGLSSDTSSADHPQDLHRPSRCSGRPGPITTSGSRRSGRVRSARDPPAPRLVEPCGDREMQPGDTGDWAVTELRQRLRRPLGWRRRCRRDGISRVHRADLQGRLVGPPRGPPRSGKLRGHNREEPPSARLPRSGSMTWVCCPSTYVVLELVGYWDDCAPDRVED